MRKFINSLSSFPLMGILMLILAFSMGIATLVEKNFGTDTAHVLIYKSLWFELLFLLLAVNLLLNFVLRRLYVWQRLPVGVLHISFIIILLGAALTRYVGSEGTVHIREGESSNSMLSTDTYLTVECDGRVISEKVLFSELAPRRFDETLKLDGQKVRVKSVGFIKNAVLTAKEDPSGSEMIDLVVLSENERDNYVLSKGDSLIFDNFSVGFACSGSDIQLISRDGDLLLVPDRPIEIRSMDGSTPFSVNAHDTIQAEPMRLYALDGYLLLVRKYYNHAVLSVEQGGQNSANKFSAVSLEITNGTDKQLVHVLGKRGSQGSPVSVKIGNAALNIAYGAKSFPLPFELHLLDFRMEKYPGSSSPSSYTSDLELRDSDRGVTRKVSVFMNNTLSYRGFKFYQSSFDSDEAGTLLSVNADRLGTTVTYIGYLLLAIGIVLSLFSKHSRFHTLSRRLKKYSKAAIVFLLLFQSGILSARETNNVGLPSISRLTISEFSGLWVQGPDSRIEPVSTLASEILRKVSRKSSLDGRSPGEVVLSLYLYPTQWRDVPLVYLSNGQLKKMLGTDKARVPLSIFFDEQGNYKLAGELKAAFAKMPTFRNMYEKELINVDERVNICFMVMNGDMLALFPGVDKNVKWLVPGNVPEGFSADESALVSQGFSRLRDKASVADESAVYQLIKQVSSFQNKYASSYLPSEAKKKAEMFYNSLNPFKRVFPAYLLIGFSLLIVLFVNIFKQKTIDNRVRVGFTALLVAGFFLHTFGLAMRWYIAGHAPWSNGYESMVYVAWAAMLAGLLFGRKYPMVFAIASMLSGVILFVAHLSWMSPEITHLAPVLKSYWLMFHVAIITASYGFVGMSAFIGLLVLVLYCLANNGNRRSIHLAVLQLTTISEMSVTVGLYMLTLGSFLGGVWANESWGRYWGWDPKETWALVTIVVYAFIAHMRLIPSLKGVYGFNVATVLGFLSVLMTYFGVNYYLTGLHSYAGGEAGPIHWSVYLALMLVFGLMLVSNYRKNRLTFDEYEGLVD